MPSSKASEVRRGEATRNSALWAAYGDALGFITELAPTPGAVGRRIGRDRVESVVPWRRLIGGKFGVEVELPAGVYSDDTQLRLATGRAIRGSGRFDIESFSKIELPVFLAYGLGVGRGTRAAAAELAKRPVRWSNNFFDIRGASYVSGGGNGAAMRVHPHVWASPNLTPESFLGDVFTNAICTHGHARGFVGACWHALILARCMETGSVPDLDDQASALGSLAQLPEIVRELPLVGDVWLPIWEQRASTQFEEAVAKTIDEALGDLTSVELDSGDDSSSIYGRVALSVGGIEPTTRGSGMKSALLAGVLAYVFRDDPVDGLLTCANLLGSDTDTIASMAGALLGATVKEPPPQPVIDHDYIGSEARRLAAIAARTSQEGFPYPDLLKWTPPKAQLDMVGTFEDGLAVAGLGAARPVSEPLTAKGRDNAIWQWLELEFGQHVFVRRREPPRPIKRELLPGGRRTQTPTLFSAEATRPAAAPTARVTQTPQRLDLDAATRQAINSGFDPQLIGRLLLAFADREGVDFAVAFSAIIAKARVARRGREGNNGGS